MFTRRFWMGIVILLLAVVLGGGGRLPTALVQENDALAAGAPVAQASGLVSDGQFVLGPNAAGFDLAGYLESSESLLFAHADVIELWCGYASVNPRVVLTVIEMQSGMVAGTSEGDLSRPAGYVEPGFDLQIERLVVDLATAFYEHLYTFGARSENPATPGMRVRLVLADGSVTTRPANSSSGSFAVASVLASLSTADELDARLSVSHQDGFSRTYRRLFPGDDPLDTSNQIRAAATPPDDLLQFPFPVGSSWWFNGPHNWNGAGYGRPYSSMDFGTWNGSCGSPPNDWSVAAAGGSGYHPSGHSCWFRIDHGGGWTTSYYHLRNVRGNGSVDQDENVGTIACEVCAGGFSSVPHVHFSLLHNGAYTEIDGTRLSGWTVHEGNGSYGSGYIEREGEVRYPFDHVYNDGVAIPLTSETLQLDVHESPSDGAAGPVRSTGVLTDGQIYAVTISGTLSLWTSSAWSTVCKGVPEDWPQVPSPGTTNGRVGLDSAYIFAVPSAAAALCASSAEPPIRNWSRPFRLELSLDDGQSWSAAVPLYQFYNPAHTYMYVVEGEGKRIQFRWVDDTTGGNYGVLTIRVETPPCDLNSQPVVLVPGWEGSAASIEADDQLSLLRDSLGTGYIEGCNLFYATEISAAQTLRESAAAVQAALRTAYTASIALDPAWNRHFDIIAYSYGGVSARGYLESDLYALDWARADYWVRVDNLFTLGTPHGGGVAALPGAARTAAEQGPAAHRASPWQMTPWQMHVWSSLYAQPDRVCYRAIGGDGFGQDLPLWLDQWYDQLSSVPNDLGIYRWSSQGLTLEEERYPRVVTSSTPDIHRHSEGYGLQSYRSYVSPADTVDDLIVPSLGAPLSQCPPGAPAARALSGPWVSEPPVPSVLLSAGDILSGTVVTGSFPVNWAGPSVTYLHWHSGDLGLVLTDPAGHTLDPVSVQSDPSVDYVELDALAHNAAYVFSSTLTGTWGFTVTGVTLPFTTAYRLLAVPSLPVGVSAQASPWQRLGQPAVISAELSYSATVPIVGAGAQASVSRPDGAVDVLVLHDDGLHYDGGATDGVYGNSYPDTDWGGFYAVVVEATGVYQTKPFTRTAEAYFSVSSGAAALAGSYDDKPRDPNGDGSYDWLDVMMSVTVTQTGTYVFAADLVAAEGAYLGHAVARAALPSGLVTLTLTFDGEDIRFGGEDGPFTVTNVLLADEGLDHLLLDRADEVHVTPAYDHQQFGRPHFFFPIISRDG